MTAPREPIDPDWTFEQALKELSHRHRPGGKTSGPVRNRLLESWGVAVGRERAVREFDQALAKYRSWTAAGKACRARPATLKRLREFYEGLSDPVDGQVGLTVYFNTRLSAMDRLLVEGTIVGVLGRDTDCHLAEYREDGDTAIVRLQAGSNDDLIAVADALWNRHWTRQQRARESLPARVGSLLRLDSVEAALSELVSRTRRIELRQPTPDAVEMLNDQGEAHVREKILKPGRTRLQKVWKRAVKVGGKKVGDELLDEVVNGVRGLLKDSDDE